MVDRRKSPIEQERIEPEACSIDARLDILGRVPFFSGLSTVEIARINPLFRELGFQPDEVIYYAGDEARRLYVVAAGKVKLVRHSMSGKDVLLDILTPGEFFGALSALGDEVYPDTAQAQTIACVLGIGAEAFRSILDAFPAVALRMLDVMSGRLKEAHERIRQLSAHSVERRIAYTLLKLAEKFGELQEVGLLIQVPLSRDDLAEMTGATTETASRVMSQFQKDGLVDSGRQWVAITGRAGLEAILAEELD
jgi:CRP-like cAMP-binding protein